MASSSKPLCFCNAMVSPIIRLMLFEIKMSLRFSDVFKSLNYAYGIDNSHSSADEKDDIDETAGSKKIFDDDKENLIPRDEDGYVGRTVDNECNDKVEKCINYESFYDSLIGGGVNFPYNLDNFEISEEENETYDIDMAVSSNKQNASIKQNKNVDDSGNLQEVSVAMVESHIMEDRPKKKKARTEPQKIADNALKHTVLVPCFNCKQTCLEKITEERRKIIHDSYWAAILLILLILLILQILTEQQSSWLISTVTTHPPTR